MTNVGYARHSVQEVCARQELAWQKLPLNERRSLPASERCPPNKYAVEVKHTFSRFPQLCHKVSSEGCSHCEWRLKRLNMIHDLTKREEQFNQVEGEREVTFFPGPHGLNVDEQSGIITKVQPDSQGARNGIQAGFRVTTVNDGEYLSKTLDSAVNGTDAYRCSIAVEASMIVFFQPGKSLGVKLNGNTIYRVSAKGQANREGVKDGWRIIAIGDVDCLGEGNAIKPNTVKILHEAENCDTPFKFKVTFDMEMELLAFHDGDSDGLKVVQDQAPVHDMLKVRGLFNLLPGPPRRARQHQDATVVNLAGIKPPIDMQRFITEHSSLLSEYQVRHLSEIIANFSAKVNDGKVSSATMTKRDFENAVARSGLQHRLTHRKVGLAFLRLVELDRQVEERRGEHQIEVSQNPRAMRRSNSVASMVSLASKSSKISRASKTKEKQMQRTGKLTPREMRNKINYDWHAEEPDEEEDPNKSESFHILSWWRACEHCAVQLDCRIDVNEDVEWTFAIYDMLDIRLPWKPLVGPEDEECVEDERGKHFRGLLLGITRPPFTSSPKLQNSSLTGIRARDGHLFHNGCEQELNECGATNHVHLPIKRPVHGPAIVTLRLDRRRLKHDAYNTKNYACRLWIQRVVGYNEQYEDRKAQILIDNIGIPPETSLTPVIYANCPVNDVANGVKLWNCGNTASLGMRLADTTIGAQHSYRHDQVESRGRFSSDLSDESDNLLSERSPERSQHDQSARSRLDSSISL